jgi:Ca2+-binding RTX toxin-like protein
VSAAAQRRRSAGVAGKTILQTSPAQHALTGTGGNDEVRAAKGVHKVRVGAGHDQVLAGRGGNRVYGGTGSDELTSFSGPDMLKGGTGHDMLQGGSGNDVSIGNAGSDSLFDAKGKDRMFGGTGADRIVTRDRSKQDDRVNCGPGRDMVIADPGDRIVLKSGDTVPAGAFTAHHKPADSTCELVFSSVHMPPRNPPHIGHRAGRPRGAPEPQWPVLD